MRAHPREFLSSEHICITLVTKSNKHFITHGVLFQMAILLLIFYGICYILTNKKKLINAGEKEEHELH